MKRWWLFVLVPLLMLAPVVPVQSETVPVDQIQLAAGSPGMTLDPSSGKPGETIAVHLSGFSSHNGHAVAMVSFDGKAVNGGGTTIAGDGSASTTFRIPDVAPGTYTVSADGYASPAAAPAAATPTNTPVPPATVTSTTAPTATNTVTSAPTPTNTMVPTPTNTPMPSPTVTPTNTPIPPTATNTPKTEVVPSNTAAPAAPLSPLTLSPASETFDVTYCGTLGPNNSCLTPFSLTVTASGGDQTYFFNTAGSLPAGATFKPMVPAANEATVVTADMGKSCFSGCTFTITVQDRSGERASQTYTVQEVMPPPLALAPPSGELNYFCSSRSLQGACLTPASWTFTGSGGTGTYAFSINPAPPPGWSFTSRGNQAILATPPMGLGYYCLGGVGLTSAGSGASAGGKAAVIIGCRFTVTVTDPAGQSAAQTYDIVVTFPPATLTPTSTSTDTPTPTFTPVGTTAPMILPVGILGSSNAPGNAPSVDYSTPVVPTVVSVSGADVAASRAQGLQPDGDHASATLTVTQQPPPPIGLSQSATCATTPTVGGTSTCTITETVTNNTNDTLDFSHTVTNHLSSNVRFVSATASTGSIAPSSSEVIWNNFQLAPHQSASAQIQVSFTPTAAQVGSAIILSDGITADAVDVTTGKKYTVTYGTLSANVRVVAARSSSPPAAPPATPAAAPGNHGGAVAASPTTSGGTSSPSTSSLPKTGGGGSDFDSAYLRRFGLHRAPPP